ncbi:MAG: rod-binding protein [Burkholderiales bacterium]
MNTIDPATLAFDPKQLGSLRTQAARNDPEALRKVGREFEAMLVNQLMKTARATRFVEDDPMDSPAMQTYTGLLDEQYAQSVTRGHGLGLADALVRQIELAGKQPSSPAGTRS